MRVFRITGAYRLYLQKFYRANSHLLNADYASHRAALAHNAFGWADFWEHALAPLGIEVESAIANADVLQRAWAKEHLGKGARPAAAILAEQVRRFQPDILFIEDFSAVSRVWIDHIRRLYPSIRSVIGWCGAPHGEVDVFAGYDIVLSNIPDIVKDFRGKGHQAVFFRHAFEPRVLERLRADAGKRFGLTFVGQLGLGKKEHHRRFHILKELARQHRIDVFCELGDQATLRSRCKTVIASAWYHSLHGLIRLGVSKAFLNGIPFVRRPFDWRGMPRVDFSQRLAFRHLYPSVFGLDMFQTLQDSRITFNSHIDIAGDSASNMRLFEATGVGACLVTDWKSDLKNIFEVDKEVVAYRTVEECVEKVGWLLSNPAKADRIAAAGQRRTLRDHTFAARAPLLADIFSKAIRHEFAS